jgi:hypothetical protein
VGYIRRVVGTAQTDRLVQSQLDGRTSWLKRQQEKIARALESAAATSLPPTFPKQSMRAQEVYDSYVSLKGVERDRRAPKTSLPGRSRLPQPAGPNSPPGDRTAAARKVGHHDSNPHAITLSDVLAALDSLCLLQ